MTAHATKKRRMGRLHKKRNQGGKGRKDSGHGDTLKEVKGRENKEQALI